VNTASTKRARKRQKGGAGANAKGGARSVRREYLLPAGPATGDEISERAWLVASVAVLFAAAALRLAALGLKPMHHDEGVNGFFLMNLLRTGQYAYNPENYHGPTLYFLTLPLAYVADKLHVLDSWVLRLITAAFGVGTVWLVLALRRYVGALGALAGAALVAVSPACVFYSRYFIHESLFVFFTLGIVVSALRLHETGEARYLVLASASAAMLFATKETAFISVGTLGLALLVARLWPRLAGGGPAEESAVGLKKFIASDDAAAAVAGAVVLFAFVWVLFYSSFFTHWQGVSDSFKAFDLWSKTGMSEFHEKPFYTYVWWLLQEESPLLLLSVAGAGLALFERRKNRFAVFAAAWAFGLLAAYSLIKYKTPWLVLSFVVPMGVVGGYCVQKFARWGRGWHMPALVLLVLAVAVCLFQTYTLNFRNYDDDTYPYVYSHTRRQAVEMVREVERVGALTGTKEPAVAIASGEYWPLPWYFRDNTRVGYTTEVYASYDPQATPVVIARKSDDAQTDTYLKLLPLLSGKYTEVGTYELRPGVELVLFEGRDIAGR
jgi:uncharacterized protein (TIGR03663 family)